MSQSSPKVDNVPNLEELKSCHSVSAANNTKNYQKDGSIILCTKESDSKTNAELSFRHNVSESEIQAFERNGGVSSGSDEEVNIATSDNGMPKTKKKKIDALSERMVQVKLNSKETTPKKIQEEKIEIKKRGRGRPPKLDSAKKAKLAQSEQVENVERVMETSEFSFNRFPGSRKSNTKNNVFMEKTALEPSEYLPEEFGICESELQDNMKSSSNTKDKNKCTNSNSKRSIKATNQDSNHDLREQDVKSKKQYLDEKYMDDYTHQQSKFPSNSPNMTNEVEQFVAEEIRDLIPGELIPIDMEVGYTLAPSSFNKNPLVFQSKVDAGIYSQDVIGKDIYVYVFKEILPHAYNEDPFLVYVELPNRDLQLLKNDDEKPVRFNMNEEDENSANASSSIDHRQFPTPPRLDLYNDESKYVLDTCEDLQSDYIFLERVQPTPIDDHNNDPRIAAIQINWLQFCVDNLNVHPEVLYSDMQPQVVIKVDGVTELSESAIEMNTCNSSGSSRPVWKSCYQDGDIEQCTRTAGLYKVSDCSSTLTLNQEVLNKPEPSANSSTMFDDSNNALTFIPLCKSEESLLSIDEEKDLYPKRKSSKDFGARCIPPKSPCYQRDVDSRHNTQIDSQAWRKRLLDLSEQHKRKSLNNSSKDKQKKKAELISFVMPPKRPLSRPLSKTSKKRKITISNRDIGKIQVRFLPEIEIQPSRIIRVEIKTFKKTDRICAIRLWQHYDKFGPGGECNICHVFIPSDLALEQHVMKCKTNKNKNKCNECKTIFLSLRLLKNHAKVCGVKKKEIELYYCMACDTNLTSKSGFLSHTKNVKHQEILKKEEKIFEQSSQVFTGTSVKATEDESDDSLGGMVLIEIEEEDYFEEEEHLTKEVEGPVRMKAVEKNLRTLRIYKYQTALITNLMKVSEWRKQLDKPFDEEQNGEKQKKSKRLSKEKKDKINESNSGPFEEYVDVTSDNWSYEKPKFSEGQKMDLRGKLTKGNRFAGRIVDLRRRYKNFKSPPKILYKQLQDLDVFKKTRKCASPYYPHPLAADLYELDLSVDEENKDDKVLYNLDKKIIVPHHLYDKRRRRKYIDLDKPSEYYTFSIDDSGNFIMERGTVDNPFNGVNTNDMPNFGNNDSDEFSKILQETSNILEDNRYMFTGSPSKRCEYFPNMSYVESSSYVPQGSTFNNEFITQGMNIIPSVSGDMLPRDLSTPPRNSNVGNIDNNDGNLEDCSKNLADLTGMPLSPSGYDKCFEDLWDSAL